MARSSSFSDAWAARRNQPDAAWCAGSDHGVAAGRSSMSTTLKLMKTTIVKRSSLASPRTSYPCPLVGGRVIAV